MTLTVVKTTALTGTITNAQLAGGIDLTAKVTGTLPIGNGGTNSTATTFVNATTNVTGALPIVNGGTGSTTFAPGKLKQVQFANFDSNTTVSSTGSQTATYLTDQITPSASSSKIEVSMDYTWQINSTDADGRAQANWRIFRSINGGTYTGVYPENNNTNIALGYVDEDNILHQNHFVILFMDAPNTINTVDYKLYIQLDEGDNISIGQNAYSQITLKEYLQND